MERTRHNGPPSPITFTIPQSAVCETAPRNTGGLVGRMGRPQRRPVHGTSPRDNGGDAETCRGQTLRVEMDLRRSHGRFTSSCRSNWSVPMEVTDRRCPSSESATRERRPEQTAKRGTIHPLWKARRTDGQPATKFEMRASRPETLGPVPNS